MIHLADTWGILGMQLAASFILIDFTCHWVQFTSGQHLFPVEREREREARQQTVCGCKDHARQLGQIVVHVSANKVSHNERPANASVARVANTCKGRTFIGTNSSGQGDQLFSSSSSAVGRQLLDSENGRVNYGGFAKFLFASALGKTMTRFACVKRTGKG